MYALVEKETTWQQVGSDRNIAKQFRPAQGRVSIPSDKRIVLGLRGRRSKGKTPALELIDQIDESQLLSLTCVFSDHIPEELQRLKRRTELKMFATTLSKMNDDGLGVVCKSAEQLECLSTPETGITDNGIVSVGKLSGLRMLNVYGTSVTEKGLRHLQKLTNCGSLTCDCPEFTEVAFVMWRVSTSFGS